MKYEEHKMTPDMWAEKYHGTHNEFAALDIARKTHSVKKSPGDKNITTSYIPGKKKIEIDAWEEREQKVKQLFFDLLEVRSKELLDKNDFPMPHLVSTIVKLMPQKIEQKSETVHSFADAIIKAKAELQSLKTFDAEGNPI